MNKFNIEKSRLYCSVEKTASPLFFSLVDYRNNYFTSNNPDKIIEFYNGFENRDQLIQWMKERPKGATYIHEIEGDKDIIVVIPTADFSGKYAKECRENIFRGLHIVFVESGEIPDPYFNYAHNCNVGIRRAMEYKPKWIVLSNDDVQSVDHSGNLVKELSRLDNNIIKTVYTNGSRQTANRNFVTKLNYLGNFVSLILSYESISKIFKKRHEELYIVRIILSRFIEKPGERFIVSGEPRKIKDILFFKKLYTYYNFEAFGIFSPKSINNQIGIFDETYINANEDQDFSIALSKESDKIAWIDYSIEGIGATSLGSGQQRRLRTIASECYFSLRMEQSLLNENVK